MAKKNRNDSAQVSTQALVHLAQAGIDYEVIEYEHSMTMDHGYALDTAAVLGVDPDSVFKTLLVEADGKPAVAVIPASRMLNLKRIAKAVGAKSAHMMDPSKAERLTGYVTGGISPIGQKTSSPTVIDEDALIADHILVSGGKRTLSVSVAPEDLAQVTGASFAAISD